MLVWWSSNHQTSTKLTDSHNCSKCNALRTFNIEVHYTVFTFCILYSAVSSKKYFARCSSCGATEEANPSHVDPFLTKNPIPWWYRNSLKIGIPLTIMVSVLFLGYQELVMPNAKYWPIYKAPDRTFVVRFPFYGVDFEENDSDPQGPFKRYVAKFDNGTNYRVFQRQLQSKEFIEADEGDKLAGYGDSIVKQLKGKVLKDTIIHCRAGMGRELQCEVNDEFLITRIYMHKDKAYLVSYCRFKNVEQSDSAAIFLDSFSFCDQLEEQ